MDQITTRSVESPPLDFEALLRSQMQRIVTIAARYADAGGVDDLVQEISLALWRGHRRFRGDSSVETWVYRVAFNTAMTGIRQRIRERQRKDNLHRESVQAPASEGFSQADILNHFLDSLSEIDASVLMMYLDGLTAAQMSSVLGIGAGAISVRVSRIKEKFSNTYIE